MTALPGSLRRQRMLAGLLLVAMACAVLGGWLRLPLLEGIDRQFYDLRLRWQDAPPSRHVVLVDVDERSLSEVGRWPWPRATMARLADQLAREGQASVIGFDILFAENQAEPGEDRALAQALARTPSVLGYYLSSDRDGRRSGALPAPVLERSAVTGLHLTMTDWSGYGANLAMFQKAARGGGFFNSLIDPDGVVRGLPMLGSLDDRVYESFALAVLREHLGGATLVLRPHAIGLSGSRGRIDLPLSDGLSALVPFAAAPAGDGRRAGSGRFDTVSAADVLAGTVDWSRFAGRVVLVGSSAPGLTDLRATPVSETLPGVEIHAALIESALAAGEGAPAVRLRPPEGPLVAAAVAGLVGVALAVAMAGFGAVGTALAGLVGAAALIGLEALAWGRLNWVLPGAAGLAMVAALMLANLLLGWVVEGRARRAVSELFGEYVSPELVAQMTRDPMRFSSMASENRELTIMFADIRGFTRIAETMEPGELRELINEFLTVMTEVIHAHGGTVDKYIGDAVMAFWGAPLDDPQHADRAVAAAQGMLAQAARLREVFSARGWPVLSIGVGLNTGVARVGDMGSRLRRTYTVLGDAVNLAARIEGLTKQFNEPIIVGEQTVRLATSHRFRELAQVTVTGRSEPARLFVPLTDGATAPAASASTLAEPGARTARHEGSRLRV